MSPSPRPLHLVARCRGPILGRVLLGPGIWLLAIGLGGLNASWAQGQIIGGDARILSGVTRASGREVGPQVAFHGDLGLAVWYEDGSLQPLHCAFTQDGGATWIPGGFVPGYEDDMGYASVCAGPSGSFYVLNRREITNVPDLEVRRGEIAGGSLVWQPAVTVASAPILEHPALACDPLTGDLYVSYTHTYRVSLSPETYSATIYFTRSGDGGASWSTPIALSPATCGGSQVAVGPEGQVYVVWQDFASAQVMVRRSLDQGANFAPAAPVGPILENVNTAPPGLEYIAVHIHTTWLHSLRVPHYPALVVDRSPGSRRGTVYVAWPEMASGTEGPALGSVYETEPNNFFVSANRAVIGQDLAGYTPSSDIQQPADNEVWYFEGTAGQTVTLTGSFQWTPPLGFPEAGIAVFACDQDTVFPFELTRTNVSDGSFYVPPLVLTLPRTGRYYILIANGGAYSQSYLLRLRELQVAPGSVARDHRDIVLTSSADGGQSWSPKVRVSGGAAGYDDILAALAVDEAGQVHAAWYGRQDDPLCGMLADTYWTLSRDGGATFLPPRRISSASGSWASLHNIDAGIAGDCLGLATVGAMAHLLWMDTRNKAISSSDIYGARIDASGPTAVVVARFSAEPAEEGVRVRWTVAGGTAVAGFRLDRTQREQAWDELSLTMPSPAAGPEFEVVDASAEPGERYRYRLEVLLAEGGSLWAGPVEVTLPSARARALSLRVTPNPSAGPVAVQLAIPEPGAASVVVFDLAGKEVATLHEGPAAAGILQLQWGGRSREGREVSPGLYWVRARLGGRQVVQRIALVQ